MSKRTMTITEALAELRTITKRIETKQQFVRSNVGRHSMAVDPHEADGGSVKLVREAMQSRTDLCERAIAIRTAIQKKNLTTKLALNGTERTIAEWLAWRRDVEPLERRFLSDLANTLSTARNKIRNEVPQGMEADLIAHINEKRLADDIENHEEVVGALDGQLTLLNSTTTITV